MRTRDRPWSNAVTRRVLAQEKGTYHGHLDLSQTHKLASRGVQHYQLLAPQVYTSCFHNKAHGDEEGVYLSYGQRKDQSVVSSTKTVLRAASSQPVLTNFSIKTSSKNKPLLGQDTINKQLSSSVDGRATGQISSLFSHSFYLRTISLLSRRAKSTSQRRLKDWSLNRDNSTSTGDILQTEKSEKGRLFYFTSKIAAPDAENTSEITVDTITKRGMKNRYRNINETLFHLSPESESPDVNDEVTFANIHNGKKSPSFGQISSNASFPKASSPELPPIAIEASRGDKWKMSPSCASSTIGLKIPADRRPTAARRTNDYSRRHSTATAASSALSTVMLANRRPNKDTLPVCRYHSDSSVYSLSVGGSYPSKGSDSTTVSSVIPRAKEVENNNSSHQGKGDVRSSGVKDAYLGGRNRNPTLHSAYPRGRLESLYEGQSGRKSVAYSLNNNAENSNSKAAGKYSFNNVDVSNKVTRIQNVNNIIAHNNSRLTHNNNVINNIPSAMLLPTSVFVKDVTNNQNGPSYKTPNRKSRVDGNSTRTNADCMSTNKSRITRSQSENKLGGKSTSTRPQEKTKAHSTSRNFSADRLVKLRSNSQKYRRGVTSNQNHQGGKCQNPNSVANINNKYSRQIVNGTSIKDDMYDFEDSIETSDRLVEWLNVVNNIDRYDTDPRDDIIDYSDEPPQTDTAIHLVYEGD